MPHPPLCAALSPAVSERRLLAPTTCSYTQCDVDPACPCSNKACCALDKCLAPEKQYCAVTPDASNCAVGCYPSGSGDHEWRGGVPLTCDNSPSVASCGPDLIYCKFEDGIATCAYPSGNQTAWELRVSCDPADCTCNVNLPNSVSKVVYKLGNFYW